MRSNVTHITHPAAAYGCAPAWRQPVTGVCAAFGGVMVGAKPVGNPVVCGSVDFVIKTQARLQTHLDYPV